MTVKVHLKIRVSDVAGIVPTHGTLAWGELMANTVDGRVWTADQTGNILELTGHGADGAPSIGPPGPPGPAGAPGSSITGPPGPAGPSTTVNAT